MKKIMTLFTAVALATTLGLAGCKKDKKKEEAPAPAPVPTDTKPTDVKPTDTTPTPDTKPTDTTPTPTDTTAAGGTGMAECDEYMKTVEAYGKCDKLPAAAKEATMKAVEGMKAAWGANMTDDAKKAAAGACKTGSEGLKTGAKALGCEI